jgi:hypothetical protein
MKRSLATDEIQQVIADLSIFLEQTKKIWDEENPVSKSWFRMSKTYLVKSTIFLIGITDSLIHYVEEIIPQGPDKKAAVLMVIAKVFDHISTAAFPIWLKPFAPMIREVVISIIITNLVDFIVAKYRKGLWKKEKEKNEEQKDQAFTVCSGRLR